MQLEILGITLHAYGLIIGVGLIVGLLLVYKKAEAEQIEQKHIEKLFIWALLFAVLGARLWHVMTDYWLYLDQPLAILIIWQGGLSIFGGLAGGLYGLWLGIRYHNYHQHSFLSFLDLAVFGLPFGQAIGRWGNYLNQELYGWPTSLPWGIYIEPAYRIEGYENFEKFHPLFLYEMLLLTGLGILIWLVSKKKNWEFGTGIFVSTYVLIYSLGRFLLDFLRLGQPAVLGGLGINQLILIFVILGVGHWCYRYWSSRLPKTLLRLWLVAGIFSYGLLALMAVSTSQSFSDATNSNFYQLNLIQKEAVYTDIMLGDKKIRVEVVQSPEEIARGLSGRVEIGSDGMLFVFPNRQEVVFWMKDMSFDLDLIWIVDQKVIAISSQVKAPTSDQLEYELELYPSPGKVDFVLEVPAGWSQRNGIVIGDQFRLL